MSHEDDQVLLRRYAAARDRGDHALATACWEQLAVNNFDRVKQIVKAFRFTPGGKGIPEHEQGSAVSEAYMRVMAMGANFRKREVGQFRAALVTCVQNACRDYGRKELRHQQRIAGSIDVTYEPDGEAGPYDSALADYDADRRREAIEAVEAELDRLEAEQLVAWAIGQLENANYREVLELTYLQPVPADEIAERLGISVDNVYQRRRRGLERLERILRDHRS